MMMKMMMIMNILMAQYMFLATANSLLIKASENPADAASHPIRHILRLTSGPLCSVIFISDASAPISMPKELERDEASMGVGVFSVTSGPDDVNATVMSDIIPLARKLRRASWCTTAVVFSNKIPFLVDFAEAALRGRLLVWASRLLVVTSSLQKPQQQALLQDLLSQHWTFAMMNTMFITYRETSRVNRWSVYLHRPYSPEGPGNVEVAGWTKSQGLRLLSKDLNLFPDKYSNFYGGDINVTALPFPPFWDEEELTLPDGTKTIQYSGTDANLLSAVAQTLNLTFSVIATRTWKEGLELVMQRRSYMTSVYHLVYPQRLDLFDFSYAYEWAFLGFGMTKPSLRPQWQSLYYPLTTQVWVVVLVSLFVVAILLAVIGQSGMAMGDTKGRRLTAVKSAEEVLRTLLGQDFSPNLPKTDSTRTLMAAWLFCSVILGTAYRGNLTASLTSPKYPPRAENLEQLIKVVDQVTWGPYGETSKLFFSKSENPVFRKFAELSIVGPPVDEGLQQALETRRSATISGRRYMKQRIAEKFTHPDGTTDLYIGRESIIPGLSGWPIPHDAPYKSNIDWCIIAVLEAGLYEKWSSEFIDGTRRRSAQRQRDYIAQQGTAVKSNSDQPEAKGDRFMALTIVHLQGPLIILLLGLNAAALVFAAEVLRMKCDS